jgi:putative drug exporter of the RND superfamily
MAHGGGWPSVVTAKRNSVEEPNMDGGVEPGRRALRMRPESRRALVVLACWAVATAVLAVLGVGVADKLSPTVVVAPGTGAAAAQKLSEERFGPQQLVPVLLQGPPRSLQSQGPGLVAALATQPHARVLSPWNAPAGTAGLAPSPDAAMVLVSLQMSEARAIAQQPKLEALVDAHVSAPVHASVTGQPSIDRALREESLSVARRDGLIAVGVLLLLSLVLLRAPVAAALLTALAAAASLSGLGLLALLEGLFAVDGVAVALGVMSGLALGGAYGMIVMDRLHRDGARTGGLMQEGWGVLLAGAGLVAALAVASAIAPTKVIVSVGLGVLLCGATAAIGAGVALPAALTLLGRRATWTLPMPAFLAAAGVRLADARARASAAAPVIAPIATAVLILIALPALTLKTGQPGIQQLPPGNKARASYEAVAASMGKGWPTPYTVVLASSSGPLTTAVMLLQIDALQQQLAQPQAVASVSGPGTLSGQTKPLGKLPRALRESGQLLSGGKRELERLLAGLGQAGAGAKQLQEGLGQAASGAGELHSGAGAAQSGAAQLHTGLAKAHSGSAMLQAGLGQALSGARALKDGATQALAGSVELYDGVSSVGAPVHSSLPSTQELKGLTANTSSAIGSLKGQADGAGGDLTRSTQALESMTSGRSDPRYAEALDAVRAASAAVAGVSGGLAGAQGDATLASERAATLAVQQGFLDTAMKELLGGAEKLRNGLAKLRAGNAKLAAGIEQLATGGGQLTSGLVRLQDGAGELEAGLGLLTGGAGELQSGLTAGVGPVGELVGGLGLLEAGVAQFSGKLPSPKDLEELQRDSPGLFSSGYFVLAAIEGAPPQASNAAAFTLNVSRGGNAGQIAVISQYVSGDPRTVALGEQVSGQIARFGRQQHLTTGLGGPAANLGDLTSAGESRTWWAIGGALLAVLLVLAAGLLALGAALMTTALALLVVAASFGVLTLLFSGGSPPLGGPGHLDPISEVGIFAAALGVSLAFLAPAMADLRRRRAAYARAGAGADGPAGAAVPAAAAGAGGGADAGAGGGGQGVPRVPRELTGAGGCALAGVLSVAVLIPFATSELSAVRQFAVGIALAIALAALVARPLVLPIAAKLLGDRGWWPGCAQLRSKEQQSATTPDGSQATMRLPDARP